jgi:hypothetical protein
MQLAKQYFQIIGYQLETVNNYHCQQIMIETHYSEIALGRSFYDHMRRFRLAEIELSIIVIGATILLVILVQYYLKCFAFATGAVTIYEILGHPTIITVGV